MTAIATIVRPVLFDGDELTLETDAEFGIWRSSPAGYEAFLEPVCVQNRQRLTRDDCCRFWGERRVEAAEDDALEAWLETGPADARQARAEERERYREEML